MTRLVLATRNEGKVVELRAILAAPPGLDAELVGLDAFRDVGDIAETGATFADNALIKARAVAEATGLPAVADDSGLCVDALNGMPGILSARWAGRHGDDTANLDLLLAQLAEVPDDRRGAALVCAAAAGGPGKGGRVVEGGPPGALLRAPRGPGGLGHQPLFVPVGESRTTAQMSATEKNGISHRGRAFRALMGPLCEMLQVRRNVV